MERTNTSNQLHELEYIIGIYNSTDDFGNQSGSGVKSLQIYARATDTSDGSDAKFSEASLIGIIEDVDNTPSYSRLGDSGAPYYNDQLVLRNKDSKPVTTDSDKTPRHNANNIYQFKFNNYISGKYYNVWILAVDKAGNIEKLDDDKPAESQFQTTVKALITTERIIDSIAPQFESIETLSDLTWNGSKYSLNPPTGVTDTTSARSYFKDKVVIFTITGAKKERYITDATFSAGKVVLDIDITGLSNANADTGSTKLLPVVVVNGAVGRLDLSYPLSNSVNLSCYKIERRVANDSAKPVATDNYLTETQLSGVSWTLVGYINAESFSDIGLILSRANINDTPDTKKFFYRVTPVSQYKDYSGATPIELLGQSIYATKLNFNSVNYRPSAGEVPTTIASVVMSSGTDGSITLKWSKSQDTNNDLKGYEIQRLRYINGVADASYINIASRETELFTSISEAPYELKYIDSGLETYQPNKVTYGYRVRAIDWAGNVSAWTVFLGPGSVSNIAAIDTTAPDTTGTTLTVIGRMGGWKGAIALPDNSNYDDVEGAYIYAKSDAVSASVSGSTARFLGFFAIEPGQRVINFIDLSVPSSGSKWYAQYSYKLKDVNGNVSTATSYGPASPVASETPQTVADNIAPSVSGFTVTMGKIPDNDPSVTPIVVVSSTSNTVTVSGLNIGANDLKDKRISITTGDMQTTEIIASNLATSGGNTQITINGTWVTNPVAGVNCSIDPTHIKVTVTIPTTNLTGTATSGTTTTIADSGKSWATDQFKGWDVSINGVVNQIIGNTATVLTLRDALGSVASGAYAITLPADLAGYKIYRGRWTGSAIESWELVTDTFTANTSTFTVVDRFVTSGDWKYGVQSYDLSTHDSMIKESAASITVADKSAPGIPEIKGVLGGTGNLFIYWNAPSEDVDFYELEIKDSSDKYVLDNNGAYIPSASRNATAQKEQTLTPQFTLYKVVDSKDAIKAWKFRVIAYDYSGNAITTHTAKTLAAGMFFLDSYEPASGDAPANPSGFNVASDNDGNVIISIPAGNLNTEIGSLIIQRRDNNKYQNNGADNWTDFATVANINGPEIDSANNIISDISYTDYVNKRVVSEYKLKAVGRNGIANSFFTIAKSVNVVDFTGYDLASKTLSMTIDKDFGQLKFRFKDVIDKSNARYEIWRTPCAKDPSDNNDWNATKFFTKTTVQPKAVNANWELIDSVPSTQSNNTDFDYITYVDNDWDNNGTIESGKTASGTPFTSLATPYDGQACYAIIGIDEWGNRGTPFFVPDGSFGVNSVITMPIEPRENSVPDGAVFFNFNKGVQSSIGHAPKNIPQGVLYKGYGIQPTGSFSYNLDKFSGDYTILLKKLEKSLTNMNVNLSSIVDVFLYDTKNDTIDSSWRFDSSKSWYNEAFSSTRGGSKEFPEVAVIIATSIYIYIFDYQTGLLWMRFDRNGVSIGWAEGSYFPCAELTNTATSVKMINGKLYFTTAKDTYYVCGLIIVDFINDSGRLIGSSTSAQSNWRTRLYGQKISGRNTNATVTSDSSSAICNVNTNCIDSSSISSKQYSAVATDAGISIVNETDNKVINSIDTSKFTKVAIHEDFLFALKDTDRSIYRSQARVSTMFMSYVLEMDMASNAKVISDTSSVYNGMTFGRIKLSSEIRESLEGTKIKIVDGNSANPNTFTVGYNSGRYIYFDRGSVDLETLYSSGTMTIDSFGMKDVMTSAIYTGNKAVKFDGKDDYLDVANNAALNFGTGDFSIELFVNVAKMTTNQNYLLCKGSCGMVGYSLYYDNTQNTIAFGIQATGGTNQSLQTVAPLNKNLHIVGVAERSKTLKIFINGVLAKDAAYLSGNSNSITNTTPLRIGSFDNTGLNQGKADIVKARLWNYALSASRIYELSQGASIRTEDKWGSGNLVTTFNNNPSYPFETFTFSGSNFSSLVNSSGLGWCGSNVFSIVSGIVYELRAKVTVNSGTPPQVVLQNSNTGGGGYQSQITRLASGQNVVGLVATETGTSCLGIYADVAFNGAIEFQLIKKGCVAEYLADNYDQSTGTWKSTENAEGGATTLNATQATASYRPVSVSMPNRYVTKAFPKSIAPAKDKQLAVALANNNMTVLDGSSSYWKCDSPQDLDMNGSEMISNGTIETDTTGWAAIGNHSIARITSDKHSGSACLQVVSTGVGDSNNQVTSPWNNFVQNVKYTREVWMKSVSGNTSVVISLAGAVSEAVTITTSWAKYVLNFPCTFSGSGSLRFFLAGAGTFLIDDVSLTEAYDFSIITESKKVGSSNWDSILQFDNTLRIKRNSSSGNPDINTKTVLNINDTINNFYVSDSHAEDNLIHTNIFSYSRIGNISAFCDGVAGMSASGSMVGKLQFSTYNKLYCGVNANGTELFNGSIGRIQFIKGIALTQADVDYIQANGFQDKDYWASRGAKLVLDVNWNQNDGLDLSDSKNHLLPVGSPTFARDNYKQANEDGGVVIISEIDV